MENRQKILSLTKDDFEITFIKASGPGGQKINKTSSGVRITHPESGASAESKNGRSQNANKKTAFKKLLETPTFKKWLKIEICRKTGVLDEINKTVDEMMDEKNIKTEVVSENGTWEQMPGIKIVASGVSNNVH